MQSFESLCIKYWKKSRMNPSSNNPIRWWEIPKNETVTSIANTIRIMGIPQRIVKVCGIIWTNLSERVMSVARLSSEDTNQKPKRARVERPLVMGFSDEDKIGTIQPHDDALVITLRIGGYDVKRVMVDQGSAAEIMYPDLYRGLDLKVENLMPYNSPLMSFEGK